MNVFFIPALLLSGTVLDRFHTTDGFSIGSRSSPVPITLLPKSAFSHVRLVAPKSRQFGSLLFVQEAARDELPIGNPLTSPHMLATLRKAIRQAPLRLLTTWSKVRRSIFILCASLIIWLGIIGWQAPPSHAVTAAASGPSTPAISRNVWTPSLDQMVEDYVQDHMFDDDVYDPVESIYREGMDDKLKGTYPRALKEITSTVLGRGVVKAERQASGNDVGKMIFKVVGFLRQRGLSEMQAIALLAGSFAVGVPFFLFNLAMGVAMQNKRSINRLMKKRYGDTYTVDATIKEDNDVELPDDDDDDDDDDEEE